MISWLLQYLDPRSYYSSEPVEESISMEEKVASMVLVSLLETTFFLWMIVYIEQALRPDMIDVVET